MSDDLFRPTIRVEPDSASSPPWRPESILYPAILGGALAATVLGVLNGRRLGLGAARLAAVVVTGAVAVSGELFVAGLLGIGTGARVLAALAGLVVWAVLRAVQRQPFRAYMYRGHEPASLVAMGWAVGFGAGLVEALAFVAVAR